MVVGKGQIWDQWKLRRSFGCQMRNQQDDHLVYFAKMQSKSNFCIVQPNRKKELRFFIGSIWIRKKFSVSMPLLTYNKLVAIHAVRSMHVNED